MDGARIFNASAACGIPVSEITENVDSVMFCLSKALGPVGSSSSAGRHIAQARLYRKRLGGGTRRSRRTCAAAVHRQEFAEQLEHTISMRAFLADSIPASPESASTTSVCRTSILSYSVIADRAVQPRNSARAE